MGGVSKVATAELDVMVQPWRRVGVLFVLSGVVFIVTTFYPLRELRAERSGLDRARARLVEVAREKAELEARITSLQSPLEIERQVRERLGMVLPGEVPVIVIESAPPPPASTRLSPSDASHSHSP